MGQAGWVRSHAYCQFHGMKALRHAYSQSRAKRLPRGGSYVYRNCVYSTLSSECSVSYFASISSTAPQSSLTQEVSREIRSSDSGVFRLFPATWWHQQKCQYWRPVKRKMAAERSESPRTKCLSLWDSREWTERYTGAIVDHVLCVPVVHGTHAFNVFLHVVKHANRGESYRCVSCKGVKR